MKLLFDENISYRIVKKIQLEFPEVSHVKFHNLLKTDDLLVWEFSKSEGYTIITNDSDFNDFSLVWIFPPKIIWLRTGNTSTKHIVELLKAKKQVICDFINETDNGILILN